jgi:hypothetical protein
MLKLTIDEKKAVLHYAMIRQDSTSVELAVIVALSGAGGEPTATLRNHKTTGDVHDLGICANWASCRYHHRCRRHAFWQPQITSTTGAAVRTGKNKTELEEYREELVSHFARSAELLDNMADDYRQLYHMAKSSSSLLPDTMADANPFRNRLANQASNDQAPVRCRATILKAHPACCAVAQNATDLSPAKILSGHSLRAASPPSQLLFNH